MPAATPPITRSVARRRSRRGLGAVCGCSVVMAPMVPSHGSCAYPEHPPADPERAASGQGHSGSPWANPRGKMPVHGPGSARRPCPRICPPCRGGSTTPLSQPAQPDHRWRGGRRGRAPGRSGLGSPPSVRGADGRRRLRTRRLPAALAAGSAAAGGRGARNHRRAARGATRWPPADRDAARCRWRDRIALAAGLHVREHALLAGGAGRHRLCRHLGPQWRRAPAVGSCQPGEPAGIGPVRGEAAGAPHWGDLPDPGGDGDRAGRHHRPWWRHERDSGRDRHHRRAGPGVRSMGLEHGSGADRRADQPGAVRGARRDGCTPARLGAADAGADPACPRAARDGDAGPHPGA